MYTTHNNRMPVLCPHCTVVVSESSKMHVVPHARSRRDFDSSLQQITLPGSVKDVQTSGSGSRFAALNWSGTVTTWKTVQSAPVEIKMSAFGGRRALQIALGENHMLIMTIDGALFTRDDYSRCIAMRRLHPTNHVNARACFITAGRRHSFAVFECDGEQRNSMWFAGTGVESGLGGATDIQYDNLTRIDAFGSCNIMAIDSSEHTVVVMQNGSMYSWGENSMGQLGVGDAEIRKRPTMVKGVMSTHHVVSVSCGSQHTIALDNHRNVFTSGRGNSGALGRGNSRHTNVFKRVNVPPAKQVSANGTRSAAVGAIGKHNGRLFVWGGIPHSRKAGIRQNPIAFTPAILPIEARVGLYANSLPYEHRLAFTMGTHSRIGAYSPICSLSQDILESIFDMCFSNGPRVPLRSQGCKNQRGGANFDI